MSSKILCCSGLVVGVLAGAAASCVAEAQEAPSGTGSDQLQEVVVTAEKRFTDLQKTPLTVSVVSAAEVTQLGKTTAEDVLQNIPSVQLRSPDVSEAPTPSIAIRGLGTDGNNKQPSVPVYVDGILIDAQNMQFYDLARVEVLRGPQGTLYGGEAVGGAVNIITNVPDLTGFAGSGGVDFGNYNLIHTTGMVNIPISDKSAARIAFNELTRSSYADTSDNNHAEFNARVKYLYNPSDTLSILLNFEAYRFSGVPLDGHQAQNLAGELIGPYAPEFGYGSVNVEKYAATINWDLGFGSLTNITAVQLARDNLQRGNLLTNNFNIVHPKKNLGTEELRLASEPASTISWVGGLYYSDYIERSQFRLGVGSPSDPALNVVPVVPWAIFDNFFDFKELAGFGQATYPISDSLRFTGGLRYSDYKISAPQSSEFLANPNSPCHCVSPQTFTAYDRPFRSVDFLARLEADLTPTNLLYASYSTGFRPGATGPGGVGYDAEKVRAVEIGSKNRFFNETVQANVAAYLNNYPAFQNNVTLYFPGTNLQLGSVVAVPARFYGIELEAIANLTADDRLTISPAFERAIYTGNGTLTGSAPIAGGTITTTLETNGKSVTHAPQVNISGSFAHVFRFTNGSWLTALVDAHYESSQAFFFDSCLYNAYSCIAENTSVAQLTQRAYTLEDASITYTAAENKYSISVYGRNLSNEKIKTGYDTTTATLATPRTLGVVVTAQF